MKIHSLFEDVLTSIVFEEAVSKSDWKAMDRWCAAGKPVLAEEPELPFVEGHHCKAERWYQAYEAQCRISEAKDVHIRELKTKLANIVHGHVPAPYGDCSQCQFVRNEALEEAAHEVFDDNCAEAIRRLKK